MAKIVLDGVAREVSVERSGDTFVVVVDGRRHTLNDVHATAGTVAFLLDRASHFAHASTGPAGTIVSLGGRNYRWMRESVDTDRPAQTLGTSGDGRVETPMPGAIIAVHVSAGDRVHAGQPLVVLESMKMHNEITAPIDGVVRRIHCGVGDQVSFGHVLVEISAEGASE
jgi:biotin carboxyl carrier protein